MVTKWIRDPTITNPKYTVRVGSWDNRYSPTWADAKAKTLTDLRRNAIRYLNSQKNPAKKYITVYDKKGEAMGIVGVQRNGKAGWFSLPSGPRYYLNKDGTLGRRY